MQHATQTRIPPGELWQIFLRIIGTLCIVYLITSLGFGVESGKSTDQVRPWRWICHFWQGIWVVMGSIAYAVAVFGIFYFVTYISRLRVPPQRP